MAPRNHSPPTEAKVLLLEASQRPASLGYCVLAIFASIQPEELTALNWSCVDIKSKLARITGSISRTDPSGERRATLAAVLEILAEKRANGYLPTSGRHIHYSRLQKNVRTSLRSTATFTEMGVADLAKKLENRFQTVLPDCCPSCSPTLAPLD